MGGEKPRRETHRFLSVRTAARHIFPERFHRLLLVDAGNVRINIGDIGAAFALVSDAERAKGGEMIGVDNQLIRGRVHLEQHILPLAGGFVFVLCPHAFCRVLPLFAVGFIIGDAQGDEVRKLGHITQLEVVGFYLIAFILVFFHGKLCHGKFCFTVQHIIAQLHADAVSQFDASALRRKRCHVAFAATTAASGKTGQKHRHHE